MQAPRSPNAVPTLTDRCAPARPSRWRSRAIPSRTSGAASRRSMGSAWTQAPTIPRRSTSPCPPRDFDGTSGARTTRGRTQAGNTTATATRGATGSRPRSQKSSCTTTPRARRTTSSTWSTARIDSRSSSGTAPRATSSRARTGPRGCSSTQRAQAGSRTSTPTLTRSGRSSRSSGSTRRATRPTGRSGRSRIPPATWPTWGIPRPRARR